jgi:2Fe-2S ferredoxin
MAHLCENSETEDDLLDKAPGLTPTSRLGCQAVMAGGEVVILIPRYTINQQA